MYNTSQLRNSATPQLRNAATFYYKYTIYCLFLLLLGFQNGISQKHPTPPNPSSMPTLGNVNSNLTLTQTHYKVTSTIFIESGATLTIPSGTHIWIGPNVQIIGKPGSKIYVLGVAPPFDWDYQIYTKSTVFFNRLNPSQEWKGIWLQGDDNIIEYAKFNGGRHGLMVQSSNNQLYQLRFTNGWRGIDSYANQNHIGEKSTFTTEYITVDSMSSAGIVLYNARAFNFLAVRSRHNAPEGIYQLFSTLDNYNSGLLQNNNIGWRILSGSKVGEYLKWNKHIRYVVFKNNNTGISSSTNEMVYLGEYGESQRALSDFINNSSWDIYRSTTQLNMFYARGCYFDPQPAKVFGGVWHDDQRSTPVPYFEQPEMYEFDKDYLEINSSSKYVENEVIKNLTKENALNKLKILAQKRFDLNTINESDLNLLDELSFNPRKEFSNEISDYSSMIYANYLLSLKVNEETISKLEILVNSKESDSNVRDELNMYLINGNVRLNRANHSLSLIEKQLEKTLDNVELFSELNFIKESILVNEETNLLVQKNDIKKGKVEQVDSKDEVIVLSIQTYPNPFNPTTTIQVNLNKDSNLKIELYNLQGQLIKTVFGGFKSSGIHSFKLDLSSYASGMYLYKVSANQTVQYGKITLTK